MAQNEIFFIMFRLNWMTQITQFDPNLCVVFSKAASFGFYMTGVAKKPVKWATKTDYACNTSINNHFLKES
jgi:hypothetical protein